MDRVPVFPSSAEHSAIWTYPGQVSDQGRYKVSPLRDITPWGQPSSCSECMHSGSGQGLSSVTAHSLYLHSR
ncbi:hypothetical protein AOLI_G00280580 [Acnodon oligacanthus]